MHQTRNPGGNRGSKNRKTRQIQNAPFTLKMQGFSWDSALSPEELLILLVAEIMCQTARLVQFPREKKEAIRRLQRARSGIATIGGAACKLTS